MLKNKNIIKFIAVIVLFLISGLCFADSPIYGPIPTEDYSLRLLKNIFGWIPGIVFTGKVTSAEVDAFNASGLFYAFNWGLLGIAGPFLCYTTIKIIADVSLEGGQMKGNVSAMWTVLRVVLGIGLLIPVPAPSDSAGKAGKACYSTANTVVMWVVFQSIKLGNYTWQEAQKITTGVNNITKPNLTEKEIAYEKEKVAWKNKDSDIISSIDYSFSRQGYGEDYVSILDIYRSYVCAITVQQCVKTAVKTAAEKMAGDKKYSKYKTDLDLIKDKVETVHYSDTENKIIMPFINTTNNDIFKSLFLGVVIKEAKNKKNGEVEVERLNLHLKYLKEGFTVQHFNGICGAYKVRDALYDDKETTYINAKTNKLQLKKDKVREVLEIIAKDAAGLVAKSSRADVKIDPTQTKILEPSGAGDTNIYLAQEGKMGGKNPLWVFAVKQPKNQTEWLAIGRIKYEEMKPLVDTLKLLAELNYAFLEGLSSDDDQPVKLNNFDEGWAMAGAKYKNLGTQPMYKPLNMLQYTGEKYPRVKPANGLFAYIDAAEDIGDERYTNVATLLEGLNKADGREGKDSGNNYKQWFIRTLDWVSYVADYTAIKYRWDMHNTRLGTAEYKQEFDAKAQGVDQQAWDMNNSEENKRDKADKERSKSLNKKMEIAKSDRDWVLNSQVGFALLATIPAVGFVALPWLIKMPNKIMNHHMQMIGSNWNKIIDKNEQTINICEKDIPMPRDAISKLQLLGYSIIEESTGYFKDMENLFSVIGTTHMAVTGYLSLVAFAWSFMPFVSVSSGVSALITSSDNINKVILSVLTTQMTVGMAVFSPMLVIGFTLALYVPFIPYMLFLFGVVSWLISVITMMFAAPMICFLMLWGAASEENPLLSRQAQEFVMQLIGLFIRPALMIAGLAVGSILCAVSIAFLNAGFYGFFDSINVALGNSRYDDNFSLDEVAHWGGVAIYAFIMISLVNMSFTTIHALYSEVMRIVGINVGSLTGGEAEKYTGEVKQEMGTMSQAGASGAKDRTSSAKDTAGASAQIGTAKAEDKEKAPVTSGGNNKPTPTT